MGERASRLRPQRSHGGRAERALLRLGHIGGPRRSAPTKSDDGTPVIKWLGFGRQYPEVQVGYDYELCRRLDCESAVIGLRADRTVIGGEALELPRSQLDRHLGES